jgi:hypothetical protein
MVGAIVRLGGKVLPPFFGQTAFVKSIKDDRLIVVVTVPSGERRELACALSDAQILQPPPKAPPR